MVPWIPCYPRPGDDALFTRSLMRIQRSHGKRKAVDKGFLQHFPTPKKHFKITIIFMHSTVGILEGPVIVNNCF